MFARFFPFAAGCLLILLVAPAVAQPFRPGFDSPPPAPLPERSPTDAEDPAVYFGFTADTVRRGRGAEVLALDPGGPADRAGLQVGDVIERCNARATPTVELLGKAIESLKAGETIPLEVRRDGILMELKVTPTSRPSSEIQPGPDDVAPLLGVVTLPVDAVRLRLPIRSGAVVDNIIPGTPAAVSRLPLGAVIVGLDDTAINSPDELRKVVASKRPGDLIRLRYYEGLRLLAMDVRLAAREATPESRRRPPMAQDRAARQQELQTLRQELQRIQERIQQLEAELR